MEIFFSIGVIVTGLFLLISVLALCQYIYAHGPDWLVGYYNNGNPSMFVVTSGIFSIIAIIIITIMILVEING